MSEKTYLIFFSIVMSVIDVLLLDWIIPNGFVEYNLGINIATSLFSTVITVIFLSLFLTIREDREWKMVKKNAYATIGMELALLFVELLRLAESEVEEISFEFSLSQAKDAKIRKEMIFLKLSELQKKESLGLPPSSVSMFRSDKQLLASLLDIKRNLGDVQIRYERHLTSKIIERLIEVQQLLELMNNSYKLDIEWNNLQSRSPLLREPLLIELVRKLMPQIHGQNLSSTDLIQSMLLACIKPLIQKTYELWKMGIEFDLV